MYTLQLYDTLSRKEQPLLPSDGKSIRMYTCGPTVYDFAHIGNFRTYLFEDLLRRTLELFGSSVCQVLNLTDVDDKTIRGALQRGVPLEVYTTEYKKAFFDDLRTLRIEQAEYYPEATAYIADMIEMVRLLIEKRHAYVHSDGSVYFSLKTAIEYGKLSHLDLETLKSGASGRISGDEYEKEGVGDFVLWKAYEPGRDGPVYWESPWGKGRPGWHLECSVMAKKLLGDTIDLHAGGVDLIFPHHENEIAQSEGCTEKPFSLHWAHAEHLLVDHKKMSKSLGNFYTLRDLLSKQYPPSAIRYFLLSTHYRTQLNFTFQGLDAAWTSVKRIRDVAARLPHESSQQQPPTPFGTAIAEFHSLFCAALARDLNISEALCALFEGIRLINHHLDSGMVSSAEQLFAAYFIQTADRILDVIRPDEEAIPEEVAALLQERLAARKNKEWARSDGLRAKIKTLGYCVEDTPEGQKVTKGVPCQEAK